MTKVISLIIKAVAFAIVVTVLCLVFMIPFAIIWALNTLFTLGIAYNFWTWLAVVVLNLTWASKEIPNLSKLKSKQPKT